MKKIVLCLVLFFVFVCNVQGETVSIRKESTPMFSTKTTSSGNRVNAQLFYIYEGDKIAYCIEPGVTLKDVVYAETSSFSDFGISDTLKKDLEMIAYYGYEYEGHQHLYYYMAAQELIWEKMGATDIVWNTGSENLTDVTSYKEEILSLIENHTTLPSFANGEYTFKVGEEATLLDSNNVLGKFESKDIEIKNGSLHFKSETPKEVEYTFTQKKKLGTSLLFWAASSQKVALFRLSDADTLSFTLKIKFVKEKGNIILHKKDSKTQEGLADVIFSLYNDKHEFLMKMETDIDGKIIWENIEYGKYYIKEEKTAKGYILSSEEIEVNLKEAKKEIEVFNQKHEMPITSNIDLIYFGGSFLMLFIGLLGIYESKENFTI